MKLMIDHPPPVTFNAPNVSDRLVPVNNSPPPESVTAAESFTPFVWPSSSAPPAFTAMLVAPASAAAVPVVSSVPKFTVTGPANVLGPYKG